MVIWLGVGFVTLIFLWIVCINALDMWEAKDRKEEYETRHSSGVDRLVKYQEKNY